MEDSEQKVKFKTIKCPRCGCNVEINLVNACDEQGEVWCCPNCEFEFHHVEE